MADVKLRPGILGSFGYSHIDQTPTTKRHDALVRAARAEGPLPIYRRLVVLRTYNKNKRTEFAKRLRSDVRWYERATGYGRK
jgi:hypothetical protein